MLYSFETVLNTLNHVVWGSIIEYLLSKKITMEISKWVIRTTTCVWHGRSRHEVVVVICIEQFVNWTRGSFSVRAVRSSLATTWSPPSCYKTFWRQTRASYCSWLCYFFTYVLPLSALSCFVYSIIQIRFLFLNGSFNGGFILNWNRFVI